MSVKTVIVGCGNMGRIHARTILACPDASLAGVVRHSDPQAPWPVPVFRSLDQALEEIAPDLVIVASPHGEHAAQARTALSHGCHVLAEKPLALMHDEAAQLVTLAREKNRLLVAVLQRRYEGFARIARTLSSEGMLGEIHLIHGLFSHRFSTTELEGWRSDPRLAGAGILHDSAPHLIDLVLSIAGGKVDSLSGCALRDPRGNPHSYSCIFTTDAGATCSLTGSYLAPEHSVQEEVSIYGEKGSLFARRFCKQWNPEPPSVFFKSTDGSIMEDYDLGSMPSGRELPLKMLLSVLAGKSPRSDLLTEAENVLEMHRVIDRILSQPGFPR